jgi:4-hydroxy-tetrahydrodipicolinate synthase
MKRLKGVVAVVPTPLNEDETPDLDGTERLIDRLASHGLPLFTLGSAGEGMNLTFATRVAATRKMAEVNDGRVPLLVGGGGFSVKASLEFIDAIADTKVDGVHVIPYDGKVGGDAVEGLYQDIADRSPLPIWLYQNTTRTNGIPIDVVARLREHENIAGAKLAGFDLRTNQGFMALDKEGFQVFGSADVQYFTFMCLGLEASSSSNSACFPELFKDLYEAIQTDSLRKAREKNSEIMAFFKQIPKGAYWHNGESTAEIKYMLHRLGICQEHCAKPFRTLNAEEKREADKVVEGYQQYLETGELSEA